MMRAHFAKRSLCVLAVAMLFALVDARAVESISFDWFEYAGRDAVFDTPLPDGHYRNPILTGFYPDPSVTRAGSKYYLVHSTFAFFPGLPIFESEDLVHWKQIGNAIDRPSQLDFKGLGVSRGVFAPTIEYQDGLFYLFNTHVDAGGNYVITARDPAGPWSDPVWLPDLEGGIDPSMFVDEDGRAYLINNGPPEGTPLYDGHRAIWIQAFDRNKLATHGPRKVLVNGGIDLRQRPIWIEGPHIFKREGWYYLNCAEGGTGPQHSQVILRARSPWGPFVAGTENPILTQRDLPPTRPHPVTNAGHADLIEATDGSWWATFLASRTYDEHHYNTGRETFLLPVTWRDGWPMILPPGSPIPSVKRGPSFMREGSQAPLSGNFTWRDEFDKPTLDFAWMQLRASPRDWFDLKGIPGSIRISPGGPLDSAATPAFLARRQQHIAFDARLALRPPQATGVAAGLAAFQNEKHWFFLGVRRKGDALEIFLEKHHGPSKQVVTAQRIPSADSIQLQTSGDGGRYSFMYRVGGPWRVIAEREEGSNLSTDVAGGFVGAVLGPHARTE